MLMTGRPGAQITLSAREVEQWPHVPAAYGLADMWVRGRPAFFHLPAVERSVAVGRHLTRLWLDLEGIGDEGARFSALLVVSELMTNVVVHTNSAGMTGRLRRTSDQMLVHILDEGGVLPFRHPHRGGDPDDYGRGLALVARSVKGLGTELEVDGGRTVWARIALTG
ncbi:ATP-binding protein [Streptomyces sp. NBC_01190]|uniref:ATP-binding protein n=1 Tax=Streptomyces sp. NBC_01190 TaxID=2903767 RepID=UPI0038676F72|nr:ATP-binding protein [Streptomyces sp. NBC_01190]WSS24073.1 ATP-binding protein [Streptomyces sp. NBC_01190]